MPITKVIKMHHCGYCDKVRNTLDEAKKCEEAHEREALNVPEGPIVFSATLSDLHKYGTFSPVAIKHHKVFEFLGLPYREFE